MDGSAIVWVSPRGVTRTPIDGSSGTEIVSPKLLEARAFAHDATNVYGVVAAEAPSIVRQPLAGGDTSVVTSALPSLPDDSTLQMFDLGDRLVVKAGDRRSDVIGGPVTPIDLYVVTKDGGAVTHVSLPDDVYGLQKPADGTSFFANGPDGAPVRYALDGTVTRLWPAGSPPLVTLDLTVAPDGTAYVAGFLKPEMWTSFGVIRPGAQATITRCIDPQASVFEDAIAVGATSVYAAVATANDANWAIVRLPK
jgi:hypothetical protein